MLMLNPILLSVKVALLAVAVDAVLATLAARIMARREFPGKDALADQVVFLDEGRTIHNPARQPMSNRHGLPFPIQQEV